MSDSTEKLLVAKQALFEALGDSAAQYLAHMKLWFRYKLTMEEFDFKIRKILSPHQTILHNKFLLAILNKIDAVNRVTLPPEIPQTETNSLKTFGSMREPFNLLDNLTAANLEGKRPPTRTNANMPKLRYGVKKLPLPDAGAMLGRFLIGAWEMGLVSVEDAIADYAVLAKETFLKNLISAIVMKSNHYKVTGEGSYYYDIGAPLKEPADTLMELNKNVSTPNCLRRPTTEGTFLSASEEKESAASKYKITLKHVLIALNDRNLIPSHAIYSINRERITQMIAYNDNK